MLLHPGDDYTTSTNTVTLASGAALDDALLIAAFSSFDVANVYTKSQADVKFALETELTGVEIDLATLDSEKADLAGATFTGAVNVVSPTAAGSKGVRQITISTSAPSGGNDGDVWLVYS